MFIYLFIYLFKFFLKVNKLWTIINVNIIFPILHIPDPPSP